MLSVKHGDRLQVDRMKEFDGEASLTCWRLTRLLLLSTHSVGRVELLSRQEFTGGVELVEHRTDKDCGL